MATRLSTRFWHPFADMSQVHEELLFTRGEGSWLWDSEGRRYLDATASLWYCNVGHGRAELAEAAARQMTTLEAYYTYATFANRPAVALADRLCELGPLDDPVAFFTGGGSESVDTAAKLVRRYWHALGEPQRTILIAREGAYHGMNAYGTSLGGIPANSEGYGELVSDIVRIPRDDTAALAQALAANAGRVAGFIGEPVIGAGGVYPPMPGYWAEVQRLCREAGVLLVLDEVVTGFGRMGKWFATQRYGIEPDVMIVAKGITSGYVPLGAVLVGPRVREPFWSESTGMFRHGYTYSGHPTACAVALANLDLIEAESLVEQAATSETVLAREIGGLTAHSLVAEVRAEGMTAAVQIESGDHLDRAEVVNEVAAEARERGVLTRGLVGHSLQISPPLTISHEDVRFMASALWDALDSVAERHGATVGAGR